MNKRPGHVVVTTEVAMCSFCGRPRTLRNEQHQLGALVRTIVTCETCHRTLSSTIGVASDSPAAEPETAEPAATASTQPHRAPGRGGATPKTPRHSTCHQVRRETGGAAQAGHPQINCIQGRQEVQVTEAAVTVERLEKTLGKDNM